jgi:glycerol-3-phosphate acyltransferase PlsX
MENPRTGLLNIGQEPIKGTKITQRAFSLLKRSRLNFIGNVEPQDIFCNRADIIVCDGFVGNVLLKVYEALSETFLQIMEQHIEQDDPGVMESLRKAFQRFHIAHHYENVGGAPLLGARKTVIVAHGRSRGPAIANAIQMAYRLAGNGVYEGMAGELEHDSILAELKHDNALLMLESLKSKWRFGESAKG